MSVSKSKCWYTNTYLHSLKCAVQLTGFLGWYGYKLDQSQGAQATVTGILTIGNAKIFSNVK
jgi:hypothetical protein